MQIVNVLQGAKELTGSTLGVDDMPGYLLDAVRISQSESLAIKAAMEEANQ